jgi:hypothetical protein
MFDRIRALAVLMAAILVTMGLAGCVSDPDEADWGKPTKVQFDSMEVEETNATINIQISLGDKNDEYTRASGALRVAIWDSKDFEMMNKTYDIKAKEFESIVFLGIKISAYNMEVPFADVQKSHDRGYDTNAGDKSMHAMVWFTHKEDTFSDEYDLGWLNPTIPDALLHPNAPPEGDLSVDNPGYVGMSVVCNGSGSFDPEGGALSYEWDWGDGDTISSLFGEAEESHVYDTAGTYTISMKVIDPEDAEATRTMDVTVEWAMGITIVAWGTETEGGYVNNTYVDIKLENMAPEEISVPQAGMDGIILKNAADETTEANGTDVVIPDALAVDGEMTVRVYYDPLEGFDPTKVDVWGREFALP